MSKQMSGAEHLEDLEDGCGCAEVWEYTSRQREEGTNGEADD